MVRSVESCPRRRFPARLITPGIVASNNAIDSAISHAGTSLTAIRGAIASGDEIDTIRATALSASLITTVSERK